MNPSLHESSSGFDAFRFGEIFYSVLSVSNSGVVESTAPERHTTNTVLDIAPQVTTLESGVYLQFLRCGTDFD
jgi:hypothetical protein